MSRSLCKNKNSMNFFFFKEAKRGLGNAYLSKSDCLYPFIHLMSVGLLQRLSLFLSKCTF